MTNIDANSQLIILTNFGRQYESATAYILRRRETRCLTTQTNVLAPNGLSAQG